ncbi:MazG-like family protein [Aliihoeflea sp. 40Bstr573]|uniref:MazG-like family protein n=1 Tax=Aliihoeflea sp. 40Bstr573 TaxID=2696467 RepID=UPI00209654C3|nr:MazG-like family protein [Aliihoeflea sp. 40Bstr573]MCO6386384.1 hypothetical protein [Aliihoeflea sp. 40Bstr573]
MTVQENRASIDALTSEIDRLRAADAEWSRLHQQVIEERAAALREVATLKLGLTFRALQKAHVDRQEEWCPEQKPDLSFRGNEMAGEVGEACNIIKKLERERHGWRGSRASVSDLGEELADVIHTAVLCAITAGIDLQKCVVAKFNATSEKNRLSVSLQELRNG